MRAYGERVKEGFLSFCWGQVGVVEYVWCAYNSLVVILPPVTSSSVQGVMCLYGKSADGVIKQLSHSSPVVFASLFQLRKQPSKQDWTIQWPCRKAGKENSPGVPPGTDPVDPHPPLPEPRGPVRMRQHYCTPAPPWEPPVYTHVDRLTVDAYPGLYPLPAGVRAPVPAPIAPGSMRSPTAPQHRHHRDPAGTRRP